MKNALPLMGMLAMCVAAPAFADMDSDHQAMTKAWFQKIDTNADGMISKQEHDAFGEKMFRDADTNSDGKISMEEFSAYKAKEKADMKTSMNDRVKTSDDAKSNSTATTNGK